VVNLSLAAFQTQPPASASSAESASAAADRPVRRDSQAEPSVEEQASEITQEPPPQPAATDETGRTDNISKRETTPPEPRPAAKTVAKRSPKPEPKQHRQARQARARPHHQPARVRTADARRPTASEHRVPRHTRMASASPASERGRTNGASSAAGGGAAQQAAASNYLAELQAAIARHRFYPREARRRGLEGKVAISFVIQADGRITDVQVARSSGSDSLDEAGIRTLEDLGRFRPIPKGIGRSRWTLRVPISYALR
jgi:protein TonB